MTHSKLQQYRQRLLDLRARLSDEIDSITEKIPDRVNPPGDLSSLPTHNADRDSEGLDKDVILIHNEETILEQVDEALHRIDDGTYGQCTECGGRIAEARLQALPYTPYCIRCAQRLEQMESR